MINGSSEWKWITPSERETYILNKKELGESIKRKRWKIREGEREIVGRKKVRLKTNKKKLGDR